MQRTQTIATIAFLTVGLLAGCSSPPPSPSAQAEESKSTPQAQKRDIGAWDIEAPRINPMDETKTQLLSTGPLGANLVVCFENGKLCSGSGVGVFISSPCIVEGDENGDEGTYERSVRVRFDADLPRKELWGIGDGRKGIFPHSQKSFLSELYKHEQLMVEFGCDQGDSDTVTYDIHNLKAAVESAGLRP